MRCPLKPYMKGASRSQLRLGTKVEMEHTKFKAAARKITSHHLHEIKNYYTLLGKMEHKALKGE